MTGISLASNIGQNLVINPLAELVQRGTSFVAIADGTYFLDRFVYKKSGAMVHTASQDTTIPTVALSGFQNNYSMKLNCTTLDSSIAAGDYATITQRIEGYNYAKVHGKNFILRFIVRATKPGIYCVSLRNSAENRSIVKEFTINSANTFHVITIPFKADSIGTWLFNNNIGMQLTWTIAAGTTFQTAGNAWTAGNFYATANQVNGCDAVNNEFYLSHVQLHEGLEAMPFNQLVRDFGKEVSLAQRYYEKSYGLGTAPGTSSSDGQLVVANQTAGTVNAYNYAFFKERKRNIPNIVHYNSSTGATGTWRDTTGIDRTSNAINIGVIGYTYQVLSVAANANAYGHFVANAEL